MNREIQEIISELQEETKIVLNIAQLLDSKEQIYLQGVLQVPNLNTKVSCVIVDNDVLSLQYENKSVLEHLQEQIEFSPLGLQVTDLENLSEEDIIEAKTQFNVLNLRLKEFNKQNFELLASKAKLAIKHDILPILDIKFCYEQQVFDEEMSQLSRKLDSLKLSEGTEKQSIQELEAEVAALLTNHQKKCLEFVRNSQTVFANLVFEVQSQEILLENLAISTNFLDILFTNFDEENFKQYSDFFYYSALNSLNRSLPSALGCLILTGPNYQQLKKFGYFINNNKSLYFLVNHKLNFGIGYPMCSILEQVKNNQNHKAFTISKLLDTVFQIIEDSKNGLFSGLDLVQPDSDIQTGNL